MRNELAPSRSTHTFSLERKLKGVPSSIFGCDMKSQFIKNLSLLVGVLALILVVDRFLFYLNAGLYEFDQILHYKLRPNIIKHWENKKPIHINAYGHHDDSLPLTKSTSELRGLIIGDSIVMGFNVTAAEAFPNQLEKILQESDLGYNTIQVINAGVSGYSTFQYLEVLKRSLKFAPDFIVVGFCMNDVTEPYVVNKSYGGTGLDYHRVLQTSEDVIGYLANETGFGRLALMARLKLSKSERLALIETHNVYDMAQNSHTRPEFIEAWEHALSDLTKIYELAKTVAIPVVLIIFPHRFQIRKEKYQEPQQIIKSHAEQNAVSYLDMTEIIEKHIADGDTIDNILLDQDHYTVHGHHLIAHELFKHLKEHDIVQEREIQ